MTAHQPEFVLPPDFYSRYWQREPLVIRSAIANFSSPLTPDDLAGLACMDGIEARIVLEKNCAIRWEVRHGPFAEELFASLPESHWSLLVQAVDHWDVDVAALRRLFPMIPNWRIDDVMVSYAADGGSVGPHYDNYDVFLLQGLGRRRWLLGGFVGAQPALEANVELRLLRNFEVQQEFILEPGDALYLPPGQAHWGIAEGECLTYSIGFRAPANGEIIDGFAADVADRLPEHQRYRDPSPLAADVNPGEITSAVVKRLHDIVVQHLSQDALAGWFGVYATERKYAADPVDFDEAAAVLKLDSGVICTPRSDSRFAFIRRDGVLDLFADGQCYPCPAQAQNFVIRLCDGLEVMQSDLDDFRDTVLALLRNGSLELE